MSGPRLISTSRPVARKPHPCFYCRGRAVHVGQRYRRDTLTFDGRIYGVIVCAPCQEIEGQVFDWSTSADEAGASGEDFHEWATEHTGDPKWGTLAEMFLRRANCACADCKENR